VPEEQGAPEDDVSIAGHEVLWRGVADRQIAPNSRRSVRPRSGAFNNSSDGTGMSVDLSSIRLQLDQGPLDCLVFAGARWIATLTAEQCRQEGQIILRRPLAENPAHAEVIGPKPAKRRKRLADVSEWLAGYAPSVHDIPEEMG
jgi:hypothetical protein